MQGCRPARAGLLAITAALLIAAPRACRRVSGSRRTLDTPPGAGPRCTALSCSLRARPVEAASARQRRGRPGDRARGDVHALRRRAPPIPSSPHGPSRSPAPVPGAPSSPPNSAKPRPHARRRSVDRGLRPHTARRRHRLPGRREATCWSATTATLLLDHVRVAHGSAALGGRHRRDRRNPRSRSYSASLIDGNVATGTNPSDGGGGNPGQRRGQRAPPS